MKRINTLWLIISNVNWSFSGGPIRDQTNQESHQNCGKKGERKRNKIGSTKNQKSGGPLGVRQQETGLPQLHEPYRSQSVDKISEQNDKRCESKQSVDA